MLINGEAFYYIRLYQGGKYKRENAHQMDH